MTKTTRAAKVRLPPTALEMAARFEGYRLVAGGDEAGRGPWAGPVAAALVILPEVFNLPGLDDSKKLNRAQRKDLYQRILDVAIGMRVELVHVEEIDKLNILRATQLAYVRALDKMLPPPDLLLLDHIKLPQLTVPARTFVRGESKSASIAAASIIAKETRDRWMEKIAQKYPEYGFARHFGYGTPEHQQALARLGPCPIHRRTFAPIRALLEQKQPTLPGLE